MKRRKPRGEEAEPSINLTPLIDVVFVILIVFILVAPLLKLERIALAPASSGETVRSVEVTSPITVYVRDDDSIWLGDARIDLHRLSIALEEARAQHPNVTPQLIQDQNSHFGVYQQVKNSFENVGFEEVELILKPS